MTDHGKTLKIKVKNRKTGALNKKKERRISSNNYLSVGVEEAMDAGDTGSLKQISAAMAHNRRVTVGKGSGTNVAMKSGIVASNKKRKSKTIGKKK
jgi:hypothetical protein